MSFAMTPQELFELALTYYNGTEDLPQDYRKAYEQFLEAAEAGHSESQFYLSQCYAYGEGIERNMEQAVVWCERSANNQYPPAQLCLARIYYSGYAVEKDYTKALYWVSQASSGNDFGEALNMLGNMLHAGEGTATDMDGAYEAYSRAAELGYTDAQYNLGRMLIMQFKEYDKAFNWILKAAEKGDVDAQQQLGEMYYDGQGVEKNIAKAIEWLTRAAEKGDVYAQNKLGMIYQEKKEFSRAFYWYKHAANNNSPNAVSNLAYLFQTGQGVDQNIPEAIRLHYLNKDTKTYIDLGEIFAFGIGVKESPYQAYRLWQKAAQKGITIVDLNLGIAHYKGLGTFRDVELAEKYLCRVADLFPVVKPIIDDIRVNGSKSNLPITFREIAIDDIPVDSEVYGEFMLYTGETTEAIKYYESHLRESHYIKLARLYNDFYGDKSKAQYYFDKAVKCQDSYAKYVVKVHDGSCNLDEIDLHTPFHLNEIIEYIFENTEINSRRKWSLLYVLYCAVNGIQWSQSDTKANDWVNLLRTKSVGRFTEEYQQLYYLCTCLPPEQLLKEYQEYILTVLEDGKENTLECPSDAYIYTLSDVIETYQPQSIAILSASMLKYIRHVPTSVSCVYNFDEEDQYIYAHLLKDAYKKSNVQIFYDLENNDNTYDIVVSSANIRLNNKFDFDLECNQQRLLEALLNDKCVKRAIILVDNEFCSSYQTNLCDIRVEMIRRKYVEAVYELPLKMFNDLKSKSYLMVLNKEIEQNSVGFYLCDKNNARVEYSEIIRTDYILNPRVYMQTVVPNEGQTVVKLGEICDINKFGRGDVDYFRELRNPDFTSLLSSAVAGEAGRSLRKNASTGLIMKYPGPNVFLKYNEGVNIYVNSSDEYYTAGTNIYSFTVKKNVMDIGYLGYLFLYDKTITEYISSIVDENGMFMPRDLLHKSVAIYTDIAVQKQLVEEAIIKERQKIGSGIDYNIVVISKDTHKLDEYIGDKGFNLFMKITDFNDKEQSIERVYDKYIEDPSKVMIDAIVVDTDTDDYEDIYTYFNTIRDRNIHLYLLKSTNDPIIPGSRLKDYFIKGNRIFTCTQQGYAEKLLSKMRDDLDSSNAPQAKIRNKYKAVFEAADALDKKYPDIGVSKTVLRYIQTGCNIDDVDNVSGPCGSFRNVCHKLLQVFVNKRLVPDIDPGAIPVMLKDGKFYDGKTQRTYILKEQFMSKYLSRALEYFCKVTNEGVHGSQDSSRLGTAALNILMEFIVWFYENDICSNKLDNIPVNPCYEDITDKLPSLKGKVCTVKAQGAGKDRYLYADNIHIKENKSLKPGMKIKIKDVGAEMIADDDRRKINDEYMVFYTSSYDIL